MHQDVESITHELKAGTNQISWSTRQKALRDTGVVLCWSSVVAAIVVASDFVLHIGLQSMLHLFS